MSLKADTYSNLIITGAVFVDPDLDIRIPPCRKVITKNPGAVRS